MTFSRTGFRNFLAIAVALGFAAMPLAFAYASMSISIGNLSGTNVSVGTDVSFTVAASGFTNPTYSVSDSLSGTSVTSSDINSSGDFSWTPSSNDVGTHNLTVTVSDSAGDTATTEESITVSQAPSVSIQSLSPSTSVTAGQTVTFNVAASGFTSPSYSLSDSFSGGTVNNTDINSSGNFSWTPTTSDVGTHTITADVSDSSGHSVSASETITVTAASSPGTVGSGGATIQGLSPGTTVTVGAPLTFSVAASSFSNPAFSVSDSFSGSTISNADINSAGYFTWTPTQNDVGTHNLTIYENDSSGHSGNVTLSITVATPSVTVTSINPGTTVLPNSALSFVVTPAGFTNPSYTLSDSFSGSTITNADINSSGDFTWTPATSQDGSHTITIYATDAAGHSANTSITINVNSGVSVVLTAVSPNSSVGAGTAVTLQAYAYGFTNPTYTMEDSFNSSSLLNSDINSSGDLYWIPTNNDAGTHNITITATDAYGHTASAETSINVAANGMLTTATNPVTTASLMFTEDLGLGVTNTQVTDLQATLKALGLYSGPVTGYYGSLTQAAVMSFQAAHGIEQIGSVGPQTRAELNTLLSSSSASAATTSSTTATSNSSGQAGDGYVFNNFLGYGSTGTDVTELQERLTALGDYSGPVTGYFGELTRAAVETFQEAHSIDQVGYVGPGTRAALNQ
jgi:peptidoglycan hydrolase-like protein with peptidoglycan-binding domain